MQAIVARRGMSARRSDDAIRGGTAAALGATSHSSGAASAWAIAR